MGLLCNMARSAECSALMLEHGVIALVAASLLHHQVQRVASGVGYVLWLFGLAPAYGVHPQLPLMLPVSSLPHSPFGVAY